MVRLAFLPLAGAALAVAGSGGNEGLALFRAPDAQGRACSTCHSPDGIELAAYDFDRTTIVRRATPHLGAERAGRIADYLLALRKAMGGKPLDPMRDRPLQPGGFILPGTTPAERDAALEPYLRRLLPTLCGPPLRTLDEARRALSEVRALDLGALPIGFALDRLSEDEFHGPEHAVVKDWFADVPPENAEFVRPLEERYLAQPSDANLAALLAGLERFNGSTSFGNQLATAKRESLLLLTHRMRTGRRVLPPGVGNPAARVVESWFRSAHVDIDPAVDARKNAFEPMDAQRRDEFMTWGWVALMLDPAFHRSLEETVSWISAQLTHAGYPLHHMLFHVVRAAARYFDPDHPLAPTQGGFAHDAIWNETFFAKGDLCRRFAANSLRMGALLEGSFSRAEVERRIGNYGLPIAPGQT